jgi:D-amino-acid oxidase
MNRRQRRIAIIGAGVSGLTCATVLANQYDVSIFAREVGPLSDSRLATAVWHIYLIKGPKELEAGDRHLAWGERTLVRLIEIASAEPASGVEMVHGVELYRIDEPSVHPAWVDIAKKRMDLRFLTRDEIANYNAIGHLPISDNHKRAIEAKPVKWGYTLFAPATKMDNYLSWLLSGVKDRNIPINQCELQSLDQVATNVDIIVNCTSLGSRQLVGDDGFTPYRGQYFILSSDSNAPKFYVGDDYHPLGMSYAIPRAGQVMVGGTAEANCADLSPTISWDDVAERAGLYFPWIKTAAARQPLGAPVVGIRPVRAQGVRLEADHSLARVPVVHNYGHGGSGFSLSWGCAEQVLAEVSGLLA